MRKRIAGAAVAAVIVMLGALAASLIGPAGSAGSAPQGSDAVVDSRSTPPEVVRMLLEVDSANIEASIRKLVSFGTRNTLSSQDDPVRGPVLARVVVGHLGGEGVGARPAR